MCHGEALVCPTCRGTHWLRTGEVEGGSYTIVRCHRCMDPEEEINAISRYLANWLKHDPAAVEVQA